MGSMWPCNTVGLMEPRLVCRLIGHLVSTKNQAWSIPKHRTLLPFQEVESDQLRLSKVTRSLCDEVPLSHRRV